MAAKDYSKDISIETKELNPTTELLNKIAGDVSLENPSNPYNSFNTALEKIAANEGGGSSKPTITKANAGALRSVTVPANSSAIIDLGVNGLELEWADLGTGEPVRIVGYDVCIFDATSVPQNTIIESWSTSVMPIHVTLHNNGNSNVSISPDDWDAFCIQATFITF